MMEAITPLQVVVRLLVAGILGGLVGLEREYQNQPAGFRTHMILCVGSCLIMLVSSYMGSRYQTADPSRIAAQVVSGIGFLGAGAILRFGVTVKGLTTAASLWTIAGVGLAVGSGFYLGALLAATIMILALSILKNLERVFLMRRGEQFLYATLRSGPEVLGRLEEVLARKDTRLLKLHVERNNLTGLWELQATISRPQEVDAAQLTAEVGAIPEVAEVEIR